MYVEESGDLRASSVNPETRQTMLKAVHHLETLSTFPVEKVRCNPIYDVELCIVWLRC